MNIKELKELIDIVTSKESIEELEIERAGVRVRIKRASNNSAVSVSAAAAVAPAPVPVLAPPSPPAQPPAPSEELVYIKSPIVGTFYAAASPTGDPFVLPGTIVEKGTVLCIVEAMKLMNEIESDVAGEIASVLVKNGQPVEYGEKLFALRPR